MNDIPTNGEMLWKLEGDDSRFYIYVITHQSRGYITRSSQNIARKILKAFLKGIATFMALLKKNWTTIKF